LSEKQKANTVTLSQEMLDIIMSLGPRQKQYLITGDESWIYWDNHIRGLWAQVRVDIQSNSKRIISSKKTMVSAYFSRGGFVSIEFLPQGQKYNSRFFTETGLPSIERDLSLGRPLLRVKGVRLHIDNAKPHS
jgi:hypothetical protein